MALQGRAALIVEDQPFVGMVASDILRESGFETFHANDGADALALLETHPEIDVVVADADIQGPLGGVELSRRLCTERPNVQVVITSGGALAPDVPSGTRILRKPYASAELRTLVAGMSLLDA